MGWEVAPNSESNLCQSHDDLYNAMSNASGASPAAKEVVIYRTALWYGYEQVKEKQMLTTNMIVEIQSHIEKNQGGIRKLPGTVLMNENTGQVVYTPPSGEDEIRELMTNLERYINEDLDDIDPLIVNGKPAVHGSSF